MTRQQLGNGPTLLVHKSHHHCRRLPEVLDVLDGEIGRTATLGVTLKLPAQPRSKAQQFFGRFRSHVLRFADPVIFEHPDQLGDPAKKNNQKHCGYMRAPLPAAPDQRWIGELLDLQQEAGANVLLTPTGLVEGADPGQELAGALAWVRTARQANPSLPMFANLAFSRQWLMNPRLRHRLLEELVESQEQLWYLRFRWAVVKPPYSHQRNADLLEGYKQLAQVARAEGKLLLLPTSGLTGWLGTAWGASGFGTGMGPAEQGLAEKPVIRMPAGIKRARRQRYFERSLLHFVSLATHQGVLGTRDYITCSCRFCRELDAANPNLDPAGWDREAAGLHYLVQMGRLLAGLHAADAQAEARKEVERALDYEAALPPGFITGEDRPVHLPAWGRLLQ